MTGATRFKEPGAFAVMRRIGNPQKVVSIINAQSCSDRDHDAGSRRYVLLCAHRQREENYWSNKREQQAGFIDVNESNKFEFTV
jgi:hypothetical protein